jgi:hypothetical protein
MKLDTVTFVRLRRLAPVLDDVLNAREVEHADRGPCFACAAMLTAIRRIPLPASRRDCAGATRRPRVAVAH